MNTQFRRWAARIVGAVALPIMLTLGLGASAYAQPTVATSTSATSSTQHASPLSYYKKYGPFYTYRSCHDAQRLFRGHYSYCKDHYRYRHNNRYYYVWYLWVRYPL